MSQSTAATAAAVGHGLIPHIGKVSFEQNYWFLFSNVAVDDIANIVICVFRLTATVL